MQVAWKEHVLYCCQDAKEEKGSQIGAKMEAAERLKGMGDKKATIESDTLSTYVRLVNHKKDPMWHFLKPISIILSLSKSHLDHALTNQKPPFSGFHHKPCI